MSGIKKHTEVAVSGHDHGSKHSVRGPTTRTITKGKGKNSGFKKRTDIAIHKVGIGTILILAVTLHVLSHVAES